jgi:H+-transporting ATPase
MALNLLACSVSMTLRVREGGGVCLCAFGVEIKVVTGEHLEIANETNLRLVGIGDNVYLAKVLMEGLTNDGHSSSNETIVGADGFAGVFSLHKDVLVKRLQGFGHLCAITGDSVGDTAALRSADVGIAFEGATDAARSAADIILMNQAWKRYVSPSANHV